MTGAGIASESPAPRGAEMVFHDPFAHDLSEKYPDIRFYGSRTLREVEQKRAVSKQPATRAAAIEAVSRELQALARSKGISAG